MRSCVSPKLHKDASLIFNYSDLTCKKSHITVIPFRQNEKLCENHDMRSWWPSVRSFSHVSSTWVHLALITLKIHFVSKLWNSPNVIWFSNRIEISYFGTLLVLIRSSSGTFSFILRNMIIYRKRIFWRSYDPLNY